MFDEYTIKDVIEEVIDYRGKTPKKLGGDWSEEKTEYMALSAKNIKKGRIVQPDTIRYVNQEMYNKWMKQEVERGTILITSEAPFGELLYWDSDDKIVLSQRLFGLKIKKEFNSRYIYYYMFSEQFQGELSGRATGSTVTGLRQPELLKCHLKVPNRKYQDIIANILMNIDKKIDLNNEINNNLHELEKNLYKEWFKDLSDDNTKKLGELCSIKYGKGLPTTKIEESGYPVYGGNGIIGYYHEYMYDDSQVLISCRGAASGNVIVSKPKSFVTNNSLILECDRKYHHYLKQYSLDRYYYEYTTGSAQPQITIDNIKDIVLNIPSDELLESFNEQMDNLELKYFSNLEEVGKLEQLRDTLLPRLMNGEIDLDNIEI